MKKVFLAVLLFAAISASAQSKQAAKDNAKPSVSGDTTSPKTYTLIFTDSALKALYAIVEQSNAPHLDVERLKQFIAEQLRKQVQATK